MSLLRSRQLETNLSFWSHCMLVFQIQVLITLKNMQHQQLEVIVWRLFFYLSKRLASFSSKSWYMRSKNFKPLKTLCFMTSWSCTVWIKAGLLWASSEWEFKFWKYKTKLAIPLSTYWFKIKKNKYVKFLKMHFNLAFPPFLWIF